MAHAAHAAAVEMDLTEVLETVTDLMALGLVRVSDAGPMITTLGETTLLLDFARDVRSAIPDATCVEFET